MRKQNLIFPIILCLFTGVAVAFGRTLPPAPVPIVNVNTLSPTEVVEDYYKYVGEGNVQLASQYVTNDLASFYRKAPDSDFRNVVTLSNVNVKGPFQISADGHYKYEVQVVATYDAWYKQVITDYSGHQLRFIYLGRNSQSEPWHILSIGTGP